MDFVTISRLFANLPPYLPYICIIPFIEPRFLNCKFDNNNVKYSYSLRGSHSYLCEGNYSYKYEVAIDEENCPISKVVTINGFNKRLLLSRIPKKNGKHRYYLTIETSYREYIACACGFYDCGDPHCMETIVIRYCKFNYVGKDFNKAVMKWIEFPSSYYNITYS
jgi:hypothetical protein